MSFLERSWDLVALVIVIFAAAFATAPRFTFRALKAAARDEGRQAIGELVNFLQLPPKMRRPFICAARQ
jgi:hypothetical protein